MEMGPGILGLPVEILQQIILYFDHSEIFHLKDVCLKFHSVCISSSVWRKVRFNKPTPNNVLTSCLPLMKNTIDLFLRGFYNCPENLSPEFFDELAAACPGLKTLRLEDWLFTLRSRLDVSHLPKSIEKLSLAGTTMLCISASSELKEMFPHLTEVDLSDYHDSGNQDLFWLWSTGVKKVIMQSTPRISWEGFPAPEQQCSVESLDLTNTSYIPLLLPTARPKAWPFVSGRNMPELKEISLRSTERMAHLSDVDLRSFFGESHKDGGEATPLMKLEDLDLRGTAVTGEGMDQDKRY
jgi:hypothetical protein